MGCRNRDESKETTMTRMFKLFACRLLDVGGAKASTMGLGGNVIEDDESYFKPA